MLSSTVESGQAISRDSEEPIGTGVAFIKLCFGLQGPSSQYQVTHWAWKKHEHVTAEAMTNSHDSF